MGSFCDKDACELGEACRASFNARMSRVGDAGRMPVARHAMQAFLFGPTTGGFLTAKFGAPVASTWLGLTFCALVLAATLVLWKLDKATRNRDMKTT